MPNEDFIKFKKYVINNIISTDIKEHFVKLKKFEELERIKTDPTEMSIKTEI